MKKLLVISILAALMAGCSQTSEDKLESLNATAQAQIDEYKFEAARATIEEIGEVDPGSLSIPYYRGLILERQLCYLDAAHEYMFIGSIDPEYTPALEGMCRSFSNIGEYTYAVRAGSELVKLHPGDPAMRLIFADALTGFGQYRAVERELLAAAKMGASENVIKLKLARVLHLRGEIDSAGVARREALKDIPESAESLRSAADLYEAVGQIDSSIAFSRRALEAAPNDHENVLDHFRRCTRLNYLYDALLTIDAITESDGGEFARTGMLIEYYRAAGLHLDTRRAANVYRALTNHSLMSVVFDIAARAEGYDLTSSTTDLATVKSMIKRGDYLPEFKEYMSYLLVVRIPLILMDLEDLKTMRELPNKYANGVDVKTRVARLMHRTGDFDGYKEFVALLEEYHRSEPEWLTGIANVNADIGVRKYDQAERLYTRALEINRWYLPAFEKMTAMFRTLHQYSDAMAVFENNPHFERTYPLIRLNKALILAESNQFEEALAILTDNYMLAIGDLSFLREFLDIAASKGNTEVVRIVSDLLIAQESAPRALQLAAVWACQLGDYQQGLDLSGRALAIEDFAPSYATKAWALHGLDRKDEAYELFEENRVKDRNNAVNNQYYSYLLASDGVDLDKASNIAREALFGSYSDFEMWMNLCFVYYQAGRYDLCRGEASKAARNHQKRPEPSYWLGMAMAKEGNEAARENFQKAIMLGLVGDKLEEAQEMVEKL